MTRIARALANGWIVALIFTAITIGATWPLASVMTTRVAADVGDPIFSAWTMMWTGGQVLKFLSGDFHALANYWNGNIFYPERLTIAYSEHLTPEMLQILPIFAITHNIVLCYNLLFLSAIILSALGMYLFVRELTGQPIAGFVAGAAFAFSPYRADQYAHIQVISTQWMPLAFYGFQRYFASGRWRALAGATTAVVVQALSCGYYLFFFAPFAAAFCLFEGFRQGAWRSRRTWLQVGAAAALGLLVIWMFARPYVAMRAINPGVGVRSAAEIRAFSADTWALATASENLAVWGKLQTMQRPEGAGFPGLTILVTGLCGLIAVLWRAGLRIQEALDLNEAAREVIALSSNDLQRNRIILQPDLAEDLPTVTGDRIQLQQVILNLLRNASDSMAGVDDRPRHMLIRTRRERDDRVYLSVQDTGTGLNTQDLEKLFEAFHTTKTAGMGIGLSVSRSIIERHRGRLWAEPNDGPGATFSFSIPCRPESSTCVASQ